MLLLSIDTLNNIIEYLDEDQNSLHSCLLVNRLWCQVSVRILWRSVWNYKTLIACLPNESRKILYENGISIPNSKPPIFNYASFCKFLSVDQININIEQLFKNHRYFLSYNSINNIYMITQEIFKLFMNQITSLKSLSFYLFKRDLIIYHTGAKECLKDLKELRCCTDISPEFFHQLSQICHNIQSLTLSFRGIISNGLTDLISSQKNLKYLYMLQFYNYENLNDIIISLTKIPNTLIKLSIHGYGGLRYASLSFISNFTNLQELILSFYNIDSFEDFKILQYVRFSKLESLKFQFEFPRNDLLIKFLENNGKNLKEFYVNKSNEELNLAVIKYCPNLRKLFSEFKNSELDSLKMILNNLHNLESIKISYNEEGFNEKDLFDILVKCSPKNVCELILSSSYKKFDLLPNELESFFLNWMNRVPRTSLSLIIINFVISDENKKIIEKYINLGIIKKFKIGY
ncbi:hypothetical protein RclHR1_01730016 [Rhizophagus clarus]|uniref:F-box domain-containing protein n=1 Tax=Rhizophagus clarus TaxID=94130 RepID=A0A2Z6RCX1_9GLOM|nr:hypothetical protein RclHR1_01730016 [Rhizophagus clarus]